MSYLLLQSDARTIPLADQSVHCVVTSPPYFGLRDYGISGQIGLEASPDVYVATMVRVFREVWRVLRDDGTCWVNMGDSYAQNETRHRNGNGSTLRGGNVSPDEAWNASTHQTGRKPAHGLTPKNLLGMPWRLAFALQADGWILRAELIWHKPNPMPESVRDRPTKAHEQVFLFSKSPRYFYDSIAISEHCGGEGIKILRGVQRSDSHRQGGVLRNHFGFQEPAAKRPFATPSVRTDTLRHLFEVCVHHAATILDSAKREQDLSLFALDSQIGQHCRDGNDSISIPGAPRIEILALLATRFSNGDIAPKQFLGELNRLGLYLGDVHQFEEPGGIVASGRSALVDADGDTAIRVDDASEVCEVDGFHDEQDSITRSCSSRSADRNSRNSRSVWTIPSHPFKGAHFATMPIKLAARCVKAGTSKRGVCGACGAPWRRVVKKVVNVSGSGRNHIAGGDRTIGQGWEGIPRANLEVSTLGWRPTCPCNAPTIPAVCFDPFAGAGTTLLVANALGRSAIGLDLKPEYLAMARRRIERPHAPHPRVRPDEVMPLFAGLAP